LSNHKSWRVKVTVIQEFPELAKQLGEAFFNEKLVQFLLNWLSDPIYSIRENSIKSLFLIGKIFGQGWVVKFAIPKL